MFAEARRWMVEDDLVGRDITDAGVLKAMGTIPRELFVPIPLESEAYQDQPLPIGEGVTISQPYIVGLMTELAAVKPGDRVLEIGTGSGYQAAVLAHMGARVTSIERHPVLARRAREALREAGYDQVEVLVADGYRGHAEAAPYDAIVVTAAPERVPQPLLEQLADGGRLVLPVGEESQVLIVITRRGDRYERRDGIPVAFVPLLHGIAARRR